MRSKFSKWQAVVVAGALGGAMGIASAQQYDLAAGTGGSTPAAAKTAVDIQGNAALSSETTVAGTPIPGSPGTQSGPSVMGASSGHGSFAPGAQVVSSYSTYSTIDTGALSGTQLRSLERHLALR